MNPGLVAPAPSGTHDIADVAGRNLTFLIGQKCHSSQQWTHPVTTLVLVAANWCQLLSGTKTASDLQPDMFFRFNCN